MLTTHNFRTFKPSVMQTPLCQSLKVEVPKYTVCSNTISITQFVWVDGHYPEKSQLELDLAEDANETYYKKNTLPKHMEFETILIDPSIQNVYLYDESSSQYLTLSAAPCMGVMNEFNERVNKLLSQKQHKEFLHKLINRTLEADPERYFLHGQFLEKFNGVVKQLKCPLECIPLDCISSSSNANKPHLTFTFELANINFSFADFGTDFPSIPFFGSILNSAIQPKLTKYRNLQFAVGLTQWTPPQEPGSEDSDIFSNSGYFTVVLVVDAEHENEANEIRVILEELITNELSQFRNLKSSYATDIPCSNWLRFADGEVIDYLSNTPKSDALDAMLSIAQLDRCSFISTGGYALLSDPHTYPVMPNVKGMHAWAESFYKLTYLQYGGFKPEYLTGLSCKKDELFIWDQHA